jgi:hypothetical protein
VPEVRLTLALLLAVVGCATPRLDDPPLGMEMVVTGLRPDERLELRDRVCELEGVTDCRLVEDPPPPPPPRRGRKKRKDDEPPPPPPPSPEAKITFGYRGSLGNLRWRIAQVPHPGLEPQRADARLSYRGFDNKAPSIEVLEPADGTATRLASIEVWVRVPDPDTAAVEIDGERGRLDQDRYTATIDVEDGDNIVPIKAVDHAGNARETSIHIIVDTHPPELEVEVEIQSYDKALLKGRIKDFDKLTVDGRDLSVDLFGSFSKEIAVDPDKSYIEVVAVDALGNTVRIKRSVKVASPMSKDSAK